MVWRFARVFLDLFLPVCLREPAVVGVVRRFLLAVRVPYILVPRLHLPALQQCPPLRPLSDRVWLVWRVGARREGRYVLEPKPCFVQRRKGADFPRLTMVVTGARAEWLASKSTNERRAVLGSINYWIIDHSHPIHLILATTTADRVFVHLREGLCTLITWPSATLQKPPTADCVPSRTH